MSQNSDLKTLTAPRIATISRNDTGPIGSCIFLATGDLRELGVDTTQTDAIAYRLVEVNGQIALDIMEYSASPVESAPDSMTD